MEKHLESTATSEPSRRGSAPKLSESERRYRTIAEAVSDVVFTRDTDGVVDWVSPSVTAVLGWSREDFVRVSLREVIHPDDLATMEFILDLSNDIDAERRRAEVRFATADGSWRWMSARLKVISDEQGRVIGTIEMLRDIHSEVVAREQLDRSLSDLRAAQEVARLASWTWSPVTDRTLWSTELFEMFGLDPAGSPPDFAEQANLYGAQSFAELSAAVAEAVRTGIAYDLEVEFVRSDSSRGWMRSWGAPVLDDRGLVVELRGYAQEITEHVAARRALERSDELLQATQRMARLGSWEWDITTDQVVWSDEMFELFGLDPAQPPPAFVDQVHLYAPESWDRVVAAAGETARTGVGYEAMELEFVRADSSWGWVEVSGSAIRDDQGVIVALRGYVLDITEQVQARQELERTAQDLREVQQLARLGSWKLDVVSQEVVTSPEVRAMFGWDPTMDRPDYDEHAEMLTPESAVRLSDALAETVATGSSYELELEVARADSTRGWMRSRGQPVLDGQGVVVEVRGYAQDITDEVEARRALEHSDQLLRETQRMARLGSWEWSIATDQVVWSDEMFVLFGLNAEEPPPDFADQAVLYTAESWERVVVAAQETARTGAPYQMELQIVRADSSRGWVYVEGSGVRDDQGVVVYQRGYLLDITAHKEAELALASSESLFRTAMLDSPIGMAMSELDGSFRVVNDALCELLRHDGSWFMDHTIQEVTHPDDVDRLEHDRATAIDGHPVVDLDPIRLVRSDGRVLWVKRVVELIDGAVGNPPYLLVQYVDTTAEHEGSEKLAYQATHDSLTGLRNWQRIMSDLEQDLDGALKNGTRVGVLFIDLDNFKVVNDSLGHAAGDEVLVTVADRIAGVLSSGERVGRLGGDEFIVVIPNLDEARRAEQVAEEIVAAVATDLMIRGHRIVPTVSIGVAVSVPDSTSTSLLRDADAALFRAKAAGRSCWRLFDGAMHTEALNRLTIEDEIRRGLSGAEFVVHYQPIVTLAERRVAGHEALVRWQHPTRGLLSPFYFLPTAEDSGLIVGIGQAVLDQVCALLAARPDLPGPISVNVSPLQLAQADFFQLFSDTVARYRVDPRRIIIEVTETAVLSLLPGTREDLEAMRELGVGIHVDDFGTGFSSISLLRDMPVTGLKLDASFVADLSEGDDEVNALSNGLAGLVSGLHLMGVAEGVEYEEQDRVLLDQGWSHAQGYLYGRPAAQPALSVPARDG